MYINILYHLTMNSKVIEPYRVYNVIEASELLGINPQTLTDYCRDGKLVCTKIGEWKILGQNIIDLLRRPRGPVDMLFESFQVKPNETNSNQFPIDNAVKTLLRNSTKSQQPATAVEAAIKIIKDKHE